MHLFEVASIARCTLLGYQIRNFSVKFFCHSLISGGSRNSKKGMRNRGSGARKSPSEVPGEGVWGLRSQKLRTLCYIHNLQQAKTSIQKHIQHDKNRMNLAQEIKHVWSSQSELVNDFDRFDWRRLRMYVH